jgi:hypothetical protein
MAKQKTRPQGAGFPGDRSIAFIRTMFSGLQRWCSRRVVP